MERTKLEIDQITPGMKLAEPITNASGITLMPAGIRLTPMFIARLKKWNVSTIEVFVEPNRDHSDDEDGKRPRRSSSTTTAVFSAEQEEFARAVVSEVSRWFVNVRDNQLMMQLWGVVTKRLIAHGKNGLLNVMRQTPGPRPATEEKA